MNKPERRHGLPESAIKKILGILADYPAIEQVILYGSRTKRNNRPGSDIDLCLHLPRFELSQQLKIETRLDDLLLPWKIDLTVRHQIERIGVDLMKRATV
jgi:uncharacterized protein